MLTEWKGFKKDIFGSFLVGRKYCELCHNGDGPLRKISERGIYEGYRHYYYHQECLEKILENPEDYSHIKVDMALDICDNLDARRRETEKKLVTAQKRIEKAREQFKGE